MNVKSYTMDEHFEKLEELIKDEDKILTVRSYALTANIPFKESLRAIEQYVETNRQSKQLYVTYTLNGEKKENKEFSVVQISDKTLGDARKLYKDDPTAVIFSIQKAKHIDYNVISLTESDAASENGALSGAIVGKNCVKRVFRKKILPPLSAATVKGKSTIFTKQNSFGNSKVKTEERIKTEEDIKTDERNESKQETKVKVNAQGSIINMFKTSQTKKIDKKEEKSIEEKSKHNGGLSNFFTRQPSKDITGKELVNKQVKKENDVKEIDNLKTDLKFEDKSSVDTKKETKKSDLFDSDTDDEILKDLDLHKKLPDTKAEKESEKVKPRQNKSKSNKKKRGNADTDNKSEKKRKRIITVEDSDSDDIFGFEKSENENVDIDEDPEPVKVETQSLPPRNKRRKAVRKTYEDEEGFIVTQTEYVYETASEDENEPDNKVLKKEEQSKPKLEKKNSSNSETEISSNKAGKSKKSAKKAPSGNQTTLLNFFKRT